MTKTSSFSPILTNNSPPNSYAEAEMNNLDLERQIALSVYPVVIILGTIWNLLTFIIMQKGSLKKVSTCFYMSMLALADTGIRH